MKKILGVFIAIIMLAVNCITMLPALAKEKFTEYIIPFVSDKTELKQLIGISNNSLLKDGVVLVPIESACEIADASIAKKK